MIFESWETIGKSFPHCWIYEGAIRDGLPHGTGKLAAMPEYCEAPQCGSVCEGNFADGRIERARCSLFLGPLAIPPAAARGTIYGGPSRYVGEIKGNTGTTSTFLGPFPIVFFGSGTLVAADEGIPSAGYPAYTDTYSGTWENGALKDLAH